MGGDNNVHVIAFGEHAQNTGMYGTLAFIYMLVCTQGVLRGRWEGDDDVPCGDASMVMFAG